MGFRNKNCPTFYPSLCATRDEWMKGVRRKDLWTKQRDVRFGNPFVDDTSNYKRQKIGRSRDHREISVMTL